MTPSCRTGRPRCVHGWEGFRPGRIELSVPVASRHASPLAVVHRVAHLDRVVRQGIAVTSAARTVVDLAGVLAPAPLGRVIDDVLLAGLASIEQVTAAFDLVAGGHPRGSGVLRDLLRERTQDGYVPSRNELEASLDTVLADPRIPPSVREAAFPWMPDEPYRVDALIPRWRRIVEVDGRRWHARVADFERDRARDHEAQRHGYEVTRFTHHQVVRRPGYAADTLVAIGMAAVGAQGLRLAS